MSGAAPAHRRIGRARQTCAWDAFEGEATLHGLLAGVARVEALRIPARHFSGMGLRLLHVQRKRWADHWVDRRSGVLVPPPAWGSFVNGVGLWDSDDTEAGQPLLVRGCRDRITPHSCRWYQAVSRDRGLSPRAEPGRARRLAKARRRCKLAG